LKIKIIIKVLTLGAFIIYKFFLIIIGCLVSTKVMTFIGDLEIVSDESN